MARGYLRKIAAWKRVTRIKPNKQALVLYNGLSGRAWRDAEEIDLTMLDQDDGVDRFVAWITEKYLDKEVVKVGKYMSDFFKNYKKGPNQEIREYNMEFDRHVNKLKEVGCVLPGPCLAWWYLDKLRLDNSSELNLLSSVGNVYELNKLQDAAVIQDRMNRRLWEGGKRFDHGNRKPQQALMADHDDDEQDDFDPEADYNLDHEDALPDEDDQEAHEAYYVAFQNAKAKYNNVLKARGTHPNASKEERLKLAKARSYCSACHRKGHWHKDPECPKNEGKATNGDGGPHTTHVVYYAEDGPLEMIADCACSRTLAGVEWLRNYIRLAKEKNVPYMVIEQDENFKFGGPKLYNSDRAVICWLCIRGKWFALKVSAVKTKVPLLVSRPALAELGMTYKMDTNEADFATLGLRGIALGFTASGHPKMDALDFDHDVGQAVWPDRWDWSVAEVYIPTKVGDREIGPMVREAYMVRAADQTESRVFEKLFYDKVDEATRELMTREELPHEHFLNWWRSHDTHRDFWVESEDYMDRIHVVPRRYMFDPASWNTSNENLKKKLIGCLHEIRESTCISCTSTCIPMTFNHNWKSTKPEHVNYMWIGRSRFKRRTTTSKSIRNVGALDPSHAKCHGEDTMEDEQGRDRGRAAGDEGPLQEGVDPAGVESHADRGERSSRHWEAQVAGHVGHEVGRPGSQMPSGGDPAPTRQLHKRNFDEASAGQRPAESGRGGELRALQGVHLQGGPGGLPEVGDGRGRGEQESQHGPGTSCQVGTGKGFGRGFIVGLCGSGGGGSDTSTGEGFNGGSAIYTHEEGEGDGPGEGREQGLADQQDPANRGCDGAGLVRGGQDHGRGDSRSGGTCGADEESQGGREEEGGRCEEDPSIAGRSKTSQKKREYWKRVEMLKMAWKKRKAELGEQSENEDMDLEADGRQEVFYVDVDEYEETKEDKYPKVNLKYPEDYELVRRLPHRRVKKCTKKRVQSMAKKVLTCLMTQVAAMAVPVADELKETFVDPVRDAYYAATGYRHTERPALLEPFAGSAHMTIEFAKKGYNVLEPRDILYGHNLFDRSQQESVLYMTSRPSNHVYFG